MSAKNPPPNTGDDYRATTRECLDRAQRALEVAEVNLDRVSELLNNTENRSLLTFTDLIAHGRARTELGEAWTTLAEAKRKTGHTGGTDG